MVWEKETFRTKRPPQRTSQSTICTHIQQWVRKRAEYHPARKQKPVPVFPFVTWTPCKSRNTAKKQGKNNRMCPAAVPPRASIRNAIKKGQHVQVWGKRAAPGQEQGWKTSLTGENRITNCGRSHYMSKNRSHKAQIYTTKFEYFLANSKTCHTFAPAKNKWIGKNCRLTLRNLFLVQ